MDTTQLKFNSLVKKLSFLKSDLEYHKAEFAERKMKFYSDLSEFLQNTKYVPSEKKFERNVIDVLKKEKSVSVPKLMDQCTKLYKKIAKLTHPDINKDKGMNELFMKAKNAVAECDWYLVYDIAGELNIDFSDVGDDHILWMQQETKKIKKMIDKITGTFEWLYSNEGANKEQILTTYCMITCDIKKNE